MRNPEDIARLQVLLDDSDKELAGINDKVEALKNRDELLRSILLAEAQVAERQQYLDVLNEQLKALGL